MKTVEKAATSTGQPGARISFAGRAFVLPASEPYDREVAFEHARYLARRHDSVELRIDGRVWQWGALSRPLAVDDRLDRSA